MGMDHIFLVVKSVFEAWLGVFAFIGGVFVFWPSVAERLRNPMEEHMRWHPRTRHVLGIAIMLLGVAYTVAVVWTALSQSREGGPVYQSQIVKKHATKILASDISRYADDCANTPDCLSNFNDTFRERANKSFSELLGEGVNRKKVFHIYEGTQNINGRAVDLDTIRAISAELNYEADQLPTPQK
jgi:hypothetical protein